MIIDVNEDVFPGSVGFQCIDDKSFYEIFVQGDGTTQKLFWYESDVLQAYVDAENWRIEEWESTLS